MCACLRGTGEVGHVSFGFLYLRRMIVEGAGVSEGSSTLLGRGYVERVTDDWVDVRTPPTRREERVPGNVEKTIPDLI